MRIRFLLIASALAATGCAGSRAIIRPSMLAEPACPHDDCRRPSRHRPAVADPAVPDADIGDDREYVPAVEAVRASASRSGRSRKQPRNPYLLVSNEGLDAGILDQMRGSVTPDTVLVDSTGTGGRIALDPYLAPPIIDIDEIRMALRGSLDIY